MKKSEALEYTIKQTKLDLNNRNTIFSNPGSSLDLWWLEPANEKFSEGFFFILNNADSKKLFVFKIPKGAINKSNFRQREDKGASQIIIPISENNFVDRRGFKFNSFLINELKY